MNLFRHPALISVTLLVTGLSLAIAENKRDSLPNGYEKLSSSAKRDELWKRVSVTPYATQDLSLNGPNIFDLFRLLNDEFLSATFINRGDQMAVGRNKLIHANGTTAKVRWAPVANEFTGVFQSGAVGLARLSIAVPASNNFTPGMAVKLFIDGQPSTNFVAMYSLDGQGSDNGFFSHSFSTAIDEPRGLSLKILAHFFSEALKKVDHPPVDERTISLTDMASIESDGTKPAQVNAPYSLTFSPSNGLSETVSDTANDFRVGLGRIEQGTVLYEIYARATADSEPVLVGQLVSESTFVASDYEDHKLFFKHPKNLAR